MRGGGGRCERVGVIVRVVNLWLSIVIVGFWMCVILGEEVGFCEWEVR